MGWMDRILMWIVPVAIVGVVAAGIVGIVRHANKADDRIVSSPFQVGDRVTVKLDGRRGVVTQVRAWSDRLEIRVRVTSRSATTNTHVLREDGPINEAPYAEVDFRTFEIEKGWREEEAGDGNAR